MSNYDECAQILKAIAHPVRIRILGELITRKKCNVNQLVGILELPQSTVSQHLAKLKAHKIITNERKGLEVYYSASNKKMNAIIEILLDKKLSHF
ncbi:ArsR/SmtB family transcription factor [Bacillus wiedmannii]|uniref:ArsR/SmtB family transcription factor n=1 Tax=Bacillus wiedmannii TaxID=1890302 RepID=UPI000BF2218F|nr:metalloregulator ArsR/SmtB family transcription factor [Bacillus wiedmannii]PEK57844.1 transcriptional regulator [Bacillus wiedmannii]